MFEKAKSGRDAFTFSLRGMTAIASTGPAPVVADDRINKVIDQHQKSAATASSAVRDFEDALARYFAPGCCGQAA